VGIECCFSPLLQVRLMALCCPSSGPVLNSFIITLQISRTIPNNSSCHCPASTRISQASITIPVDLLGLNIRSRWRQRHQPRRCNHAGRERACSFPCWLLKPKTNSTVASRSSSLTRTLKASKHSQMSSTRRARSHGSKSVDRVCCHEEAPWG
jgi:hypothetical protein